jgi:hypothetical protein
VATSTERTESGSSGPDSARICARASTVYGGILADDFSADAMVEELGTRWEIARNYFKRHAAFSARSQAVSPSWLEKPA